MSERTSVGLDVHARSVGAAAMDGETGEVRSRRLSRGLEEIVEWVRSLPGPVRVTYEAGPTGFGLARALTAAGIECVVAAPSKLQRPPGDRVKTDGATRSSWRGCCSSARSSVRVPSGGQEAARDLVRAREDARGDLMRARHRLSKLLLRQGIVYYGGHAVDRPHDVWLRAQRFDAAGLQLAFETAYDDDADASRPAGPARRGDHRDGRRQRVHRRSCTGWAACAGSSTLTGFGLAVEIGDWHRFTGATIGAYLGLVPTEHSSGSAAVTGVDHQDRQHPRPPAAGRGRLAPPPPVPRPARRCARRWEQAPAGGPRPRPAGQTGGCTTAGQVFDARKKTPGDRQRRDRPRARRLVLVPGRHGQLSQPPDPPARAVAIKASARSGPAAQL